MRSGDSQGNGMLSENLSSSFSVPSPSLENKKNVKPKKLQKAKSWYAKKGISEERQKNIVVQETAMTEFKVKTDVDNNMIIPEISDNISQLPSAIVMLDPGEGKLSTKKYVKNIFVWLIPLCISFAVLGILINLSYFFVLIVLSLLSGLFAYLDTSQNIAVEKKYFWIIAIFISPLYLYIRNKTFKTQQWNTIVTLFLYFCFFSTLLWKA